MKKLLAVFATLLFCQFANALPVVPGAVDFATNDGKTYYALVAKNGYWYIEGYRNNGASTGYSVNLTPNQYIGTNQQQIAGLAFDGTSFYALRNNLTSNIVSNDSWEIVGFNTAGVYNGFHTLANPSQWVKPSLQNYVGLDVADGGTFYGLRHNTNGSYQLIGFSGAGVYNGFNTFVSAPSTGTWEGYAAFNASPRHDVYLTNTKTVGVPGPASGLVLSTLLLGLAGRRMFKAA
jgi:hypothetical protein